MADGSGLAVLEFEPLNTVTTALVVITKQFRAPHIGELMVIPNDNDYDAMLQSVTVPANQVHVSEATVTPQVVIMNLGQINMTSVDVSYSLNGGDTVTINWTGDLAMLATDIVTFPEITLPTGNNTIIAFVENPNGNTDEYPNNDEVTKNVLVYSGNVKIISVETPLSIYCNTNTFVPSFTIKNFDSFALTSATFSFNLPGYSQEMEWEGNLGYNETTQVSFPEWWFNEGEHTMTYEIETVNGGANNATSGNSLSTNFTIIANGYLVIVDILTDCYPEETSWQLVNDETSDVMYSAGPLDGDNSHKITEMCLGDGCYTFTIFDSWGDGMSGSSWSNPADGAVTITNTSTSEVIWNFAAGGNWSQQSVQFCVSSTEIKSNISSFRIYPNPSFGLLNFEFGDVIESISVYNNLGQLMIDKSINDYTASLNIETLPQGIYLVKVNTAGETIIKKVILNK